LNSKASTNEKEVAFIEKCIIKTMRKFRESPKSFWSEDDVRCYLKQLLLKGRLFKSGPLGNVFLSFPTKNAYERRADGTLLASATGKSDHFALAGWASAVPTTWSHPTQRLSFAVELKCFPIIPEDWPVQIRNALLKLSDEANEIPLKGRFFLLLTAQQTSLLKGQLNTLFAEYPSVRCYQQLAQ
jgi:hypothetical protein